MLVAVHHARHDRQSCSLRRQARGSFSGICLVSARTVPSKGRDSPVVPHVCVVCKRVACGAVASAASAFRVSPGRRSSIGRALQSNAQPGRSARRGAGPTWVRIAAAGCGLTPVSVGGEPPTDFSGTHGLRGGRFIPWSAAGTIRRFASFWTNRPAAACVRDPGNFHRPYGRESPSRSIGRWAGSERCRRRLGRSDSVRAEGGGCLGGSDGRPAGRSRPLPVRLLMLPRRASCQLREEEARRIRRWASR